MDQDSLDYISKKWINNYTTTTTSTVDHRSPERKLADDICKYLDLIALSREDYVRIMDLINKLEARIKALEERPPTYVPYPVFPPVQPIPCSPYWRYDTISQTWVYTEPTTGTGGNP